MESEVMAFFQGGRNVFINSVFNTHVVHWNHSYIVHSKHPVQSNHSYNTIKNVHGPQPQTCINSPGPASPSSTPSESVVSPYRDASIDQNVKQFISSVEGVSDALEIDDSSKSEEVDDAEDVSDDDRPINRTYYINCQAVYTNSFNAQGVKVRDSGNYLPQVSYRGGTVVVRPSNEKQSTYTNEGASSSNTSQSAAFAQSSRSLDALLDSTYGSPPVIPPLPSQLSSLAKSGPHSVPAIEIPTRSRNNNLFQNQFMVVPPTDVPLPTLEEGHVSMAARQGDNLPATAGTKVMPTDCAQFTPKLPATTTLPGPKFQPFPTNPFLPMRMGLLPSLFIPPNLEHLPDAIQNPSLDNITVNPWRDSDPQYHPTESPPASNPSRYPLDTNSKCLEYHLDSALATALTIQTSGVSSSADILSPRAYNTLKALNALVSVEIPVSVSRTVAKDPPARFKYLKKVTKWLRIPQSPTKQDI